MTGLIVLDKPVGITSAAAVGAVKRMLPRGTKVGHAGTLDPLASGILLILIGRATRQFEQLTALPKTYVGSITLGATSASDDRGTEIVPFSDHLVAPTAEQVSDALRLFVGPLEQMPPAYSALKINGSRASDRVRAGQKVTTNARSIWIYQIDLLQYVWPSVQVQIKCGRGTYIRAIARDLGQKLNVGGYLSDLKRIAVGSYAIEQAVHLHQLNVQNLRGFLQELE